MAKPKLYLQGRRSKLVPFRRLGKTPAGKLVWTSTPYALALRAKKKLAMTFTAADKPALSHLAAKQGFDIRFVEGAAPKPTGRELVKSWMDWALANEGSYHYRQIRPIPVKAAAARKLPVCTDCSGTATITAFVGHFPDPNGNDFNGYGFTGTIRAHAKRISLAAAEIGDYIVLGKGNGSHVVQVYKPHSTNPVVFSHGQENGPRLYTLDQQVRAHGSYYTVHSIASVI